MMDINDNDPALFSLPHPRRVELAQVNRVWSSYLGPELEIMSGMLKDSHLPKEAIIRQMLNYPRFRNFFHQFKGNQVYGSTDFGALDIFLTPLRYDLMGGRIFQTSNTLERSLLATDIGGKTPAQFFRSPYRAIFLEFGETRQSPFTISNVATADHILEGAYLFQIEATLDAEEIKHTRLPAMVGVRPGEPCRLYEIVLIGSPVGKSNFLDDATRVFKLHVPDDDTPLEALMDKHLEFFLTATPERDGLQPIGQREADEIRDGIFHLAKILLYINSERAVLQPVDERSELEDKMSRLKSKKRAKLERKAHRVYNRILIGPRRDVQRPAGAAPTGKTVATHWRRGFFRSQAWGEGRAERKLLWIEPTLVNAERLDESRIEQKRYRVS